MHALVGTILQQSYGLGPDDIAQIPSGEAQLLTFMQRGEIDAAVMRTITLKTLGSAIHVRILSTVPDEWEKLIKAQSPPVLGVAVVSDDYEGKHPDAVVKYLVANIKAVRWGAAHPDEVATMLGHELQMADADAQALAKTWSATYFTSFDEADITSLLKMADIFKADGNFPGEVGRELFLTAPFQQAKAIADAAR
jgi:NitT/TauT family transport system substrate-binding protein